MHEFNQIIKERAALIKKAILDPHKPDTIKKESKNEPENTESKNNFN